MKLFVSLTRALPEVTAGTEVMEDGPQQEFCSKSPTPGRGSHSTKSRMLRSSAEVHRLPAHPAVAHTGGPLSPRPLLALYLGNRLND